MASSNHLVTVCICLLCATHSSCSAHDGLIPETEGLTKYQDLRHERFKVNALLAKGYAKNHYLYKTKNPDKIGADDSKQRTYFYKIKDNIYDDDIQAAQVKDRSGHHKKRPELRTTHYKINALSNDGKFVGDSMEDGRYVNIISDRNFRGKRRYLNAKTEESSRGGGELNDDQYNVDLSQRLQDIEQRVGANPHLNEARLDELMLDLKRDNSENGYSNYNNYAWAIKSNRDLEAMANIFDINRRSKLLKKNADVKHADKEVLDSMLRNEGEPQLKKSESNDIPLLNSAANLVDVANAQLPNNDQIYFKRKKRDAHLPDGEKKNSSDTANGTSVAGANSTEYKVNLKNIDVDFYVKKLFMQFGDRESMTMDLAGFDQMLKKLDLDRMVVEPERGQHAPIEAVINGQRSTSPNVACVNSVDLVSSLNHQANSHQSHHTHVHTDNEANSKPLNLSLDALKANIHLNANVLVSICPILLYQKVALTSYERQGCVVKREYPILSSGENKLEYVYPYDIEFHNHNEDAEDSGRPQNRTMVWAYSSLCILAISACGLLGVAVIPIMHHMYYQQILQFLVALAVGTLSGDAMLHLLPHALSSGSHGHGEQSQHNHTDSMWKGLVAMLGVVFFYFTEKCLSLITEWRKKRMRNDKKNKLPLRVRVMTNDIGCLKGSGSCSSHTGKDGFLKLPTGLSIFKPSSHSKSEEPNTVQSSGKICKHKYSEYPYCYDEIATDTQDDHHVPPRSEQKNNTPKQTNLKTEKTDEGLSVVSSNVLNEQDNNSNSNNIEADVNDTLLSGDSKSIVISVNSNNRLQPKDYVKEDFSTALANKRFEVTNGGKGRKMSDGHKRSRSADRATEMEDLNAKKSGNPEESYTVILREHSQTHHGHSHSHGHVHSPPSSLSSVVWMVIMGDGLHNFTDGMAIGAAFSSNIAGGFSTAIAVLCHELPHEIGDFAVLLKAGMSARRAVCYNLLSSLLCLLGMVVGVAAGHTPEATQWIFAAAAGMFLYIALVDMIPELSSSHSSEGSLCQCLLQLSGLACGIGIMLLIAMYEDDLKRLFG